MPSWRIIKIAVADAKSEMAALAVGAALLILVYNLHMDDGVVLYPAILTLAVMAVYLVAKSLRMARFYKQLEAAKTAASEADGETAVESHVLDTIHQVHSRHLSEIYRLRGQIEERNAVFSQFIHGMKSSVAVIELAGEKFTGGEGADILAENEKLKKGLEQALNLLRLDAFANDYVPEKFALDALVKEAINEHKRDFIYAGVYPKVSGHAMVYSDPKWCGFMVGQVVSNAVKYSPAGGHVTFEIGEGALCVTDSGDGIPPADLPRVFDMFFTGANGRRRKDATGIGLFMVKHIAGRLGVEVTVDSVMGEGTAVTFSFPLPNLTKM
jgi:signal transduction histidine kinase